MKNLITVLTMVSTQVALGQNPDNAFSEAFEDMFAYEKPVSISQNTPPDPPVPLDGGLVALLAAGGAVAYKRYRSSKV